MCILSLLRAVASVQYMYSTYMEYGVRYITLMLVENACIQAFIFMFDPRVVMNSFLAASSLTRKLDLRCSSQLPLFNECEEL